MFSKIYTESDGLNMTDRFKEYEKDFDQSVSNEYPIIVRLDGHKFTKSTKKLKSESPFNIKFDESMLESGKELFEFSKADLALVDSDELMLGSGKKLLEFSKADLALVGSDEVSLIFKPHFDKNGNYIEAPWGGRSFKIATLFSSYLSVAFQSVNKVGFELPIFDARVFNIPEHEVLNYIMSRQISLGTNAVSQYADYYVGKKITFKKNSEEKIKMLMDKGIDFESECPNHVRYGTLMGLKCGDLSMRLRRCEMTDELINEIEYKL